MESNKNVWYIGLGSLAAAALIFAVLPASVLKPVLYVLLFVGSIFLVLLVLIQRGRGGGLAGALGGMGGYSAFGTRAGDIFTRITIVAAALWILGAMALARINLTVSPYENPGTPASAPDRPAGTGAGDDKSDLIDSKSATPSPPDDAAPQETKADSPDDF